MQLEKSVADFQRVMRDNTPPAIEVKQYQLNTIKTNIHTAFQDIECVFTEPHGDGHVKVDEVRHALQVRKPPPCAATVTNITQIAIRSNDHRKGVRGASH